MRALGQLGACGGKLQDRRAAAVRAALARRQIARRQPVGEHSRVLPRRRWLSMRVGNVGMQALDPFGPVGEHRARVDRAAGFEHFSRLGDPVQLRPTHLWELGLRSAVDVFARNGVALRCELTLKTAKYAYGRPRS